MLRYAICGNIASGKSTAQKIIEAQGYKVLDTDEVCHNILNSNIKISELFKDYDVFENNKLSREKLGKLVFTDENTKQILEKIMHPIVREEIELFFRTYTNESKLFVAIPLLFEANMQDLFDKVIFIYSDDDIRLKRLIERNGYTKEYAQIRMNSQKPQSDKIKQSDIVIYNNSTLEELKEQIIKSIE